MASSKRTTVNRDITLDNFLVTEIRLDDHSRYCVMKLYDKELADRFPELMKLADKISPGRISWESLSQTERAQIVTGLHREIALQHEDAKQTEEQIRTVLQAAS